MEVWDVYDCNGNLTGLTKTKHDTFKPGKYHMGVLFHNPFPMHTLLAFPA